MFYFIVNITGGSGKTLKIWKTVKQALFEYGIPYKAYKTMGEEHTVKLAEGISSLDDPDIRIVVVGGDGTINNVLNGIKDFSRISLGVIPSGSGNDFANGLGIPKDPLDALKDILDDDKKRKVDLGRLSYEGGERIFGISSGVGLDALVCKEALTTRIKKPLNRLGVGQWVYTILTIKNLFSMDYIKGDLTLYTLKGKEQLELSQMIFTASMNVKAEGGGVPMAPDAKYDDGMLSLCAVTGIKRLKAFINFPSLLKAKHADIKGFYLKEFASMEVSLERPAVVHADGEYAGDLSEFRIDCLPGELRLMQ